jgi:RHH-type proline utilization regulon transcriptional repressor/proline dehydrogenase/delta 1-pyrroline-5-carboxylate dehydrogenase
MCLAEALLRIPDSNTADELIEDKLVKGNWKKHINTESGFLINSSSWGLLIGSRFINKQGKNSLEKALKKVISEASEPIIRNAIKAGMEILGQGFVIGETIKSAVKKAKKLKDKYGYYFSFDMLGEGARTREQAKRYYETYKNCIEFVSEHITQQTDYPDSSIYKKPNVSIKLSALHPRYELNKAEVIKKELLPDIKSLCKLAKEKGVWISIDAEESYRLDLSLMLFEELYKDKELNDWGGLGVVVQAYGKRALKILEYLKDLSQDHDVKIPVRLVKGAYWDSEIKYAQELGLKSYSVFTKKSHTDLNYLVCSDYMMDNLDNFYPQFASHSALTISSIFERLEDKNIDPKKYEMQKLFGMGDSIYRNIVNDGKHPVRIYAPVGSYEDLLPYLIRRILENGANNSFISKVADVNEPIEEILSDPIEKIISSSYTSKNIPLPEEIYSPDRINSKGYDIGNLEHLEKLKDMITEDKTSSIKEKSIINGEEVDLTDYEDHELDSAINKSIKACLDYKKNFKVTHIQDIEEKLEKLSYLIEDHEEEFFNLLTHEAKKTVTDADAEIREAIDFLRYYSSQAVQLYSERDKQKGYTGEVSKLYYRPKGIFLCISPWNFPLAIFTGQVAAALATGNSVIAKPAEQTPKLAYLLCKLAYKAGIDKRQLHLIMGDGAKVGRKLTEIQEISGFAFTGSTGTAKLINKTIAEKHDALETFNSLTAPFSISMNLSATSSCTYKTLAAEHLCPAEPNALYITSSQALSKSAELSIMKQF